MADQSTPGNAQVIEMLEAYLDLAKENKMGHIAIAMVGYPNQGAIDFAGEIALAKPTREVLGKLTDRLDEYIANWERPKVNKQLDASYVCYDLSSSPIGFDFLIWLVSAEMVRVRENAPGPLKVGFWGGLDKMRFGSSGAKRWLENVFRPLIGMIGAVEDDRALEGHCNPLFVPREIVAAAKRGEPVPKFRSGLPENNRQNVTITLREATHWAHRNSNLPAWVKFADHLRKHGERVVFIRDTEKAFQPLGDFFTDPLAATDLLVRQNIYENAKANLFVSNGPAGLAMFGDRPWLQFVTVEEEGGYAPNTAKFWTENGGVAPGEQYPWSRPDQRLVWKPDTFENILEAWNEHIAGDDRGRLSRAA